MILTCAHRTERSDIDGCLAMRMRMAREKRNTNGELTKKKKYKSTEQMNEMSFGNADRTNII